MAYLELNYLLTCIVLLMPQFVPGLYRKVAWLKNFRVFCSVIDQTFPTVKWYMPPDKALLCVRCQGFFTLTSVCILSFCFIHLRNFGCSEASYNFRNLLCLSSLQDQTNKLKMFCIIKFSRKSFSHMMKPVQNYCCKDIFSCILYPV